jgi:hypothetical protein
LSGVPVAFGLEQPKSHVRGSVVQDRELFFFGGGDELTKCQEKLNKCQVKTEGKRAPVAQFTELLDKFDDAEELKEVLTRVQKVDYNGIGNEVLNLTVDPALLVQAVSELSDASQVEFGASSQVVFDSALETIEGGIQTILKLLETTLGTSLDPISKLVTAVRKVVSKIPSGNVLPTLVSETITYIGNLIDFAVNPMYFSSRIADERDEIAKCTEEVLSCEYDGYWMTIVPQIVGEMFLGEALAAAAVAPQP